MPLIFLTAAKTSLDNRVDEGATIAVNADYIVRVDEARGGEEPLSIVELHDGTELLVRQSLYQIGSLVSQARTVHLAEPIGVDLGDQVFSG